MRRRAVVGVAAAVAVLVYVVFLRSDDSEPDAVRVDPEAPVVARQAAPALDHVVDGDPRLTGRVIDERDHPVAGARVILQTTPPRVATTSIDGTFGFDGVTPDRYDIEAIKDRACAVESIRVSERSDSITLRLQRGSQALVRVIDASTSSVIYGATVSDGIRTIDTGPDGTVRLYGLVPGHHVRVEVSAAGYAPAGGDLDASLDVDQVVERTVELVHGASVSGTVEAPDGTLVAAATVVVHAPAVHWRGTTKTDSHGRWEFPLAAAGRHTFVASAPGFTTGRTAVYLDGENPRDDIVLQLGPDGQLTGSVVDTSDRPVAAAVVVAHGAHDDNHDARTDATGHFVMHGLREGSHQVFAKTTDRASPMQDIYVSPDQPAEVKLVVDYTRIAGVVVDDRGEPVAGARVDAVPSPHADNPQWFDDAITDASGRFEVGPLAPGPYKLDARRREQGSGGIGPSAIDVVAGDTEVRLVVHDIATVTGRVVIAGHPAQHYGLVLEQVTPSTETLSPMPVARADGRFTRTGLAAGTWRATIVGPGFVRAIVNDIEVAVGATVELGDITVDPGRVVRGRVVDGSGAPIENALVIAEPQIEVVYQPDDSHDRFADALHDVVTAHTAHDGWFELAGVPSDVQVIAYRGHSHSGKTEVPDDGIFELVIDD